jgi:hypothetical protein
MKIALVVAALIATYSISNVYAEGRALPTGAESLNQFIVESVSLSVDDQIVKPPGLNWGASFDETLSYLCSVYSVESINIKGIGPIEKESICALDEKKIRELSGGDILGPEGYPTNYEDTKIYNGKAEITAFPVMIDAVPYKAIYDLSTRFKLRPVGIYLLQGSPKEELFVAHALNKVELKSVDSGLIRGKEKALIESISQRYKAKHGFSDKSQKNGRINVKHGGVSLSVMVKKGESSMTFKGTKYLKEKIEALKR